MPMKIYSPTAKGMQEMLGEVLDNPIAIYTPRNRPPELIDDEGYYGSAVLDDDIKRIIEDDD